MFKFANDRKITYFIARANIIFFFSLLSSRAQADRLFFSSIFSGFCLKKFMQFHNDFVPGGLKLVSIDYVCVLCMVFFSVCVVEWKKNRRNYSECE